MRTSAREMGWIFQCYSELNGYAPDIVTGKPVALSGLNGRTEATGFGVYLSSKLALQDVDKQVQDTRFSVQGFGNVGRHAANFLFKDGGKVIGVSDADCCIVSENGLPIDEICEQYEKGEVRALGELSKDFYEKKIDREELFQLEVDILIPAAIENSITKENVDAISANIIVEAANMPVSHEAHETLLKSGVAIIPDIFANSGGVIASYLEWSQNKQRTQFKKEKVFKIMEDKFKENWQVIKEKSNLWPDSDFRTVCYSIAIQRVFEAQKSRHPM